MFRTIMQRVRRWQKFEDDIMKLQGLDDTLLADMGIDRREIPALVRGKLRRG
jgi:uncharacterized protein YjiS (DUF1127 family)